MLQIYCKNINKSKKFPIGISLLDIYSGFNLDLPYGPVSAKVNNKVEALTFRVYNNKDVEFQTIQCSSGMRTYDEFSRMGVLLVEYIQEIKNTNISESFFYQWVISSLEKIDVQNILTW